MTPSGTATLFNIPGGLAAIDITAGPDGNLWFTTSEAQTGTYDIGRCTPTGAIKLFAVPTSATTGQEPWGIAAGPDGNVWFTLSGSDQIGRISTASWNTGQTNEYSVAINGGRTPAGPHGITTGPNGDIWFTDWTAGQIVEYPTSPVLSQTLVSSTSDNLVGTAAGPNGDEWVADDLDHMDRLCSTGTVQQYTLATFSHPYSVAEGPYPHRIGTNVVGIWFTEADANKIGVFPELSSNAVSSCGSETPEQFTIPTSGSKPLGITPGPDGALWFTEFDADKIGRVTTAGAFSEFPLPTTNAGPLGIVAGPDGNLWFTEYNANQIGRITPAGVVTEFKLTTPDSKPDGITAGPDGALWFTEYGANRIGRIAPTGAISWFNIPTTTTNSEPDGIVTGPDGNLWFTMFNTGRVGRITPQGAITSFTLGAGHPSAIAATASELEVTDAIGADGELATVLPPRAHAVVLPSGPSPATITIPIGTVVEWTQLGPVDQSVSDASGMGLFKSPSLFPGSDFSFRFAAAGTYSYAAAPSSTASPVANGTVKVPIQVSPTEVTLTYTPSFAEVTWAASPPPQGYRYDVQVEEPGSTYSNWLKGTTTQEAAYSLSGDGTYFFRSRVRNTANGEHSNWSPPEEVYVSSLTTFRPGGH
jgi:streptogramin lyase